MKMAKATERDIDAAGKALALLDTISSGYYPSREDEDDAPLMFDEDDPEHLRRLWDELKATLDAAPGWQGRVIGGMCYVILYPANGILDPEADTLELHPQWVKRETPAGVRPVEASRRTAIDEIFDEAVSAAATANAGRPKEVSWVQAASDLANHSGVAPCANTYAGCAPECGPHNRCTSGGALPEGKSNG
jgi:hypothetical protein